MTTKTTITRDSRKVAAIQALAVVGFITLIILGIMLAIYAARFVPVAVNRVGSAAVYLSHVFSPVQDDELTVVPQIPFDDNGVVSTSTATTTTTIPVAPVATTFPSAPTTPSPVYVPPAQPNYFGQPDLTMEITAIGYLRTDGDINSFVAADTIPSNRDGAVRFIITNRGTNVSGAFNVEVKVKTSGGTDTDSAESGSMRPGTSATNYATFDANRSSGTVELTLTADSDNDVSESNENNNEDSEEVSID